MSLLRVLLAIIFPPLAVADQGCGFLFSLYSFSLFVVGFPV